MIKQVLSSDWKMRRTGEGEYINAVVPGSVYTDLLREGKMEDPFFKDNEDEALRLMDYDYEYVCSFKADPKLSGCDRVLLHCDGLDTIADLELNGRSIGSACNMHRTWEYDIRDILRDENELKITFRSPNKFIKEAYEKAPTEGSEDAMPGFVHIRKAHYMFGWDWGAHLPDAGIFRPVCIMGIEKARLESVGLLQRHDKGEVYIKLNPEIDTDTVYINRNQKNHSDEKSFETLLILQDPDGNKKEYSDLSKEIKVENPKLWWPRGYGEQYLYNITVILKDKESCRELDRWERRIGLRTMTMSTAADEYGNEFAPVVNGVKVFAMGADYIPEDHLLGRVTEKTTRNLLEKAVFANFNTIRVWGGGYYPDDRFFDICDELGLMVWQDFMFACAMYDLTEEFEENIKAEFRDNIIRLRHHACLCLLCGNNEMETFTLQRTWVTKESEIRDYFIMYEHILPKLMKSLAPQVFYWPASPSSGGSLDDPNGEHKGDVHYWDVWHGNKPFSEYRKFHFRYLSEFGFQAFPSEKTIETFTDDERDKNIFSYIMERHQRNGSANGKIINYMQQTYLYPSGFSNVLYTSQLLQADAIRYGVEHFRRERGICMGTVIWQLNDCWPVTSWSSIDYCGRLKALHYFAKRFFAPVMISCMEEGEMTCETELVRRPRKVDKSVTFCVANETMKDIKAGVFWEIRDTKGGIIKENVTELEVKALSSAWTEKTELPDLKLFDEYVSYRAEVDGKTVSSGTVLLTLPKYFHYEDPCLTASVKGDEITVCAKAYARGVEIRNENEDLILSDNYFDMNAGEVTVKVHSGDVSKLKLRSVYDIR